MKNINITFKNEQDKIDFVNECEVDFEHRLDEVSCKAIKSDVNILLLSGPTCAGKTTIANKIIHDYHEVGKKVITISIDDRKIGNDEKLDYDSVDVLDLPLLEECVRHIKAGNTISVPVFDFVTQKRNGTVEYTINGDEIIIFEGIQAVYPEITSLFDTEYKGIFINVNEDVCINGVFFTKNEIRLIRRIVRDEKFRGATPEFTFYLWESVRENEEKSIFPNKDVCEIQIDSFMCYELFLMKNYLINALNDFNENSRYFDKAKSLLDKIKDLDEISYDYIPECSLYTEFLGKK